MAKAGLETGRSVVEDPESGGRHGGCSEHPGRTGTAGNNSGKFVLCMFYRTGKYAPDASEGSH